MGYCEEPIIEHRQLAPEKEKNVSAMVEEIKEARYSYLVRRMRIVVHRI